MARRGEYRLTLTADGRVLRQELKKSEGDLKRFEGSVGRVSKELKVMGTSAAQDLSGPLGRLGGMLSTLGPAGLAAGAGVGAMVTAATALGVALVNATKQAVAYGGSIADAASKNQMGVETFQAISQGMALTGVTMEQVTKATTEMQRELVKAPATFKALGLEAEKLRAMDPSEAFLSTAKAIAAIEDPAARTAAAFEVFGRSGAAVAGAVSQMGDAAERAKALGNVMSADVIAGLDKTGDAAQTLQTTWEHLWLNIGAAIGTAPGVAESIDAITDALGGISTMILENQDEIQTLIDDVFPAVAGAAVIVANGIEALIGVLLQLKQAWDVRVPDWVKMALGGNQLAGLAAISGVEFGSASREARNTAARKPALMGPGVGRRKATPARGRAGSAGAREDESAIRAMAAAMRDAKKDSDAFWDSQEKQASEFGESVLKGVLAGQALLEQESQAVADDIADSMMEAERAFDSMLDGVFRVAGGFQDLGDIIGGTLGSVLNFAGQTIGSIGSIADHLHKLKSGSFGGGFTGLLGKVGAGLGIAGAAFSIGKSIFGGIKSLFGGGKKKEETPVKTVAEEFDAVRKAAEKAGTVGSKALREIIAKARSAKEKTAEVEAFVKEQIGRATGAMGGITGTLKDGKVTGGINIASPDSAAAQATIFTSTFWAAVKEQGLVSAVDALSAPFEALREKLTSGGFDVGALLGGVGGIFDAIGKEGGPVRAALEGADALKAALEGVANAGFLTAGSFGAFQTSAADAYAQATAGGLDNQQAILAIAPLLGSIISASNEYGFAVDANTQALIDQAKAAGAAFPADPILQMRDAVRDLINEIRTMNGLPTRDWGSLPSGSLPSGGETATGGPSDFTSAATGLPLTRLQRNTLIQAHAGERALIVPKGKGVSSRTVAALAGGGESSVGGMTFAPNITMVVDTHGEARTMEKFLQKIQETAGDAILAGKGPILKALQQRGTVR